MSYEMLKKMQAANRLAADTVQYGEGKGIWDFPEMTDDTRRTTREHFASVMTANIDALMAGRVTYRDRDVYAKLQAQRQEYLDGKRDHTLVFVQWATWHQTGKCPPLLP